MPRHAPMPPATSPPDPAMTDLLARLQRYTALPDNADADDYARVIVGLQHLFNQARGDWLRTLARAQGSGALPHRALTKITGYKQHRNVQERVYEGRELLAADQAANAREAG